ncbi:MAG: hypothetical protein KJ915_09645 [Candidatus Omnitrophica bacterium]|nr:hypothetical protein [Candidatus Omnitrophota bacterium]
MIDQRIILSKKELPKSWYNIQADFSKPVTPALNPVTGKPATADSGSHKTKTALAQAYYNNKQAGVKRIATEIGAGQWEAH